MKKCGYDNKLNFEKPDQQPNSNQTNRRKINLTCYNPPFSNSVKTNNGRKASGCKYPLKGGNCRSESSFTGLQLTLALRRGSTSACA